MLKIIFPSFNSTKVSLQGKKSKKLEVSKEEEKKYFLFVSH
jgi:hypothetical protein